MAVDQTHPLYDAKIDGWRELRDAHEGEEAVKAKGEIYLPPTAAMRCDGMNVGQKGWHAYQSYKRRARFPGYVAGAVEKIVGAMHRKPPSIELPEIMEPIRENATFRGESLEVLLRQINEEQVLMGRLGLLGDVADRGDLKGQPYISIYDTESSINWDEGERDIISPQNLNLVVLNESEYERQRDLTWQFVLKYRVIVLGEPNENEAQGEGGIAQFAVFTDRDPKSMAGESSGKARSDSFEFDPEQLEPFQIKSNMAKEIPFVFVNAIDLRPEPNRSPLRSLADLCYATYMGSADYQHALFMQGQDTLVIIGGDGEDDGEPLRVGADGRIDLPPNGDAKYIGVDSTGLGEQRQAHENDHNSAREMAGELIDAVSREKESGEALGVRVAARTAALNQIALTGALGLQEILRKIARWMGANDQEVIVTPNLEFADQKMPPSDVVTLQTAKANGAPISQETIHERMHEGGLTTLTYDDEVALIESEVPLVEETENEDGPEEDENEEQGSRQLQEA